MATKKITCKHCGATMEVDEDKDILFCPYCGSKELIENNDNTIVTLAKLAVKEKHRSDERREKEIERHRKDQDEGKALTDKQTYLFIIGMAILFGGIGIIMSLIFS